jgi:hypothetical protein
MDININNSRKINLDVENILVLYKHYKDFLLPIGVILVSILVIIYIIFPQVQQYFNSANLLKAEQQKLETLTNNYNFLLLLNDAKTNSDFNLLSSALPPQKDFAGIIDAISYVSAKTGVAVGDFQFSLGNLSTVNFGGTAYPSTKININLEGSPKSIAGFINELSKTVPVAETTIINISNSDGVITVLFYYKPFPSRNISDQTAIVPLSTRDTTLIKEVSAWNFVGQPALALTPSSPASESATSSASPF